MPDSSFAPADVNAFMDQEVAALNAAWTQGAQAIQANSSGFVSSVLNYLNGTSDAENAVVANYAAAKADITKLDGVLRQQVLSGQDQSGNPYTLQQWIGFAQNVQSDITAQTGYSWDSAGLNVLEETYDATKNQVANPFQWPWYVWVGAAGAALYLSRPLFSFLSNITDKKKEHPAESTS